MPNGNKFLDEVLPGEEEAALALADLYSPKDEEEEQCIIEAEAIKLSMDEEDKKNNPSAEDLQKYNERHDYIELLKFHGQNIEDAMFHFCYKYNYFYDAKLLNTIIGARDDTVLSRLPHNYLDALAENNIYDGLNFFSQLKRENFEKIYSEDLCLLSLSEDDKKNRQQIISIIGYDPFIDHPAADRPQLYRDLTGMLTDNMRKDIPRAKAAVEVVSGYNNIRKYQNRANELINSGQLDDATQKSLDKLLEMVNKITKSVLDISEKNGFSNSRSVGSNGKGMLSDVMNTVDEHMYDDGITNYYDIATSDSLKHISDISFEALLKQVKLTGQDYSDMLVQQAHIVRLAQEMARKSEEARRLTYAKLTKQKLIDELTEEYRAKKISEEDIEEFINREYHMWDGKK